MIYHPGGRVEAVRRPLHELSFEDEVIKESSLTPGAEATDGGINE
jgi:hypothetical protein